MKIDSRVSDGFNVPEQLGKCGNALTGNEIKLYLTLKFIANSAEGEISEEELFVYLGWSRETCFRHLTKLEAKGLIVRNKQAGRKGWAHCYTLNSLKSWFNIAGRKLREDGRKKKKKLYPGRAYVIKGKQPKRLKEN